MPWYLLVIGICAIVVPSAEPERPTDIRSLRNVSLLDIFLFLLSSLQVFVLSSRFAGCFYAKHHSGSGVILCGVSPQLRTVWRMEKTTRKAARATSRAEKRP